MDTYGRFWTTARVAGLGVLFAAGVLGCHRTQAQDAGARAGADPADANLAPATLADTVYTVWPPAAESGQPARVLAQRSVNEAQQQAQDYTPRQEAAPIERRAPGGGYPGTAQGVAPQGSDPNYAQQGYDSNYAQQGYDPNGSQGGYGANGSATPLGDDQAGDLYEADLTAEASAEPPPQLPVYDQPPCPDPDDLWTPGYWGWGSAGYYWVPGVWVAAPYAGALWTPGYWGFVGDRYRFHHGFWGPHIGFYGGINYGFGYTGFGYYGGYWRDRHFFYNTAVNRVNVNVVRNVYVRNVVVNNVVVNNRYDTRVSYNGGRGGINVRPRPQEIAVLHEQRIPPMQTQLAVRREAEGNRGQFFGENHGRPQNAVVARPIAADRTLPAALPQIAPRPQGGFRNGDGRPGQQQPVAGRDGRGGFGPDGRGASGVDARGASAGDGRGASVQGGAGRPATPQPLPGQVYPYQRGQVQPNGQPAIQPGAAIQGDAGRGRGTPQPQPGAQAVPDRQTFGRNGQAGAMPNGQTAQPMQPSIQPQVSPQPRQDYQRSPGVQPQVNPQPRQDYQRSPGVQPQVNPQPRQDYQRSPGVQPQQANPQPRQDYQRQPAVQQQVNPQPRQDYQRPQNYQQQQTAPQPRWNNDGGQPRTHDDFRQPPAAQVAPRVDNGPRPQAQPQMPPQRPQPLVQQQRPEPQFQQRQQQQSQPQARPAPPAPRAEPPRAHAQDRRD